ncbi:tetratricopeptide repeat protein [Parvicella tangerina]|uniref:PPM-type phosphatase domain-containing protein n=1 Tax=Parvicella tangerina TaxID=2829795 RepID=A0A916JR11_9FLAO|nr:tetratricopeptide repeat protein [Parvicella tangerina]CAG5087829.1 hypothetical protein CRYO30217_03592 [Parvicella tangerina]
MKYLSLSLIVIQLVGLTMLAQEPCNGRLTEIKKYLASAPDSVLQLAQDIIDEDNSATCKAAAYNVQLISRIYAGKYSEGDSIAELGKEYAKSVGEDSIYGRLLAMHGMNADYKGDVEQAYFYYSKAGEVFKALDDTLNYGDAFNNIGLLYYYLNDLDSAEHYLKQAAFWFESETEDMYNRSYFLSSVYFNLANISFKNGFYNLANDRFFETLHYGEEMQNEDLQLNALANIAGVYIELEDYNLALQYINKALDLTQDAPPSKQAIVLYKKGVILDYLEKDEEALEVFTKSKDLYNSSQQWNEALMVENSIGGVLIQKGEYQKGIDLCKSLLNKKLEYGDTLGYYVICNNIALGYQGLGLYDQAAGYCEIVDNGVEPWDDFGLYLQNKKLYSEVSSAQGNSNKAYELLKEYSSSKDSSFTSDLITHQAEMDAIYELKDKEKKVAVLKKEKAVQEASLKAEKAETEKQKAIVQNQNRQKWYLFIGLALVSVFGVFMYNRFQVTRKQKLVIDQQKSEVERQKGHIEEQHKELEETHKEISDSIKYAERLQLAILPSLDDLKEKLRNSFVYFQPKDVVSGDFYWMQEYGDAILFAAADCTGHGVPGAMVSVVCSNALNRSVIEFGLKEPNKILNKTREIVIETFARSGQGIKDGMDIALCSLAGNKLKYCGANNPLWVMRKTEHLTTEQKEHRSTVVQDDVAIIEFKGNKQPVGLYEGMTDFNQTEVDLFSEDVLFIFTDGFADQFGGERNKKLMYKPFKRLLIDIRTLEMESQKEKLSTFFKEWRGDNEQVDDVCVIGVKA